MTVSAIGHGILVVGIAAAVLYGQWNSTKVHVVNLVPAIAAVGNPTARPAPPVPERPPAPAPSRATVPEPHPREAKAPEPIELPKPLPQPREAKPPEPVQLPSPAPSAPQLPARPAALPRPGEKELPALSTPAERRPLPPLTQPTASAEKPVDARPAPPPARGQATGSVAGSGALSLDVSDFPHAWYLRQILQKVEDGWQRQSKTNEPEQKPLVFVEIQRDGNIRAPKIEKSSGNAFYDQAALRAIMDASPFPPLPPEWSRPSLRVIFRFDLQRERG